MPESAVYVGRPTRWGNPYRWSDYPAYSDGRDYLDDEPYRVYFSPEQRRTWAITDFAYQYLNPIWPHKDAPSRDEIRAELAGKDLVCWCAESQPCHADVLLKIANEGR
jgi:hypothetical protein